MSTSTRQMWERVLHESPTSLMREADAPTMTDAQMRRREKYVKALKKKSADLKSRYGNRWKQVMYATATKMAMQEAAPIPTGPLTEAETEPELTSDQKKRRDEILKGLKQNVEAFKANYGDNWEAVLDATATSMALEQPKEFETTLTEEVAEDITPDEVAKGLKELDKPTEKLTAAQINRELDTLETYGFVVTMRLGIARFTQSVSEMKRLLDLQRKIDKRKSALVHEIGLRYAPMGVHHRLPDEKQYNARPVTEAVESFGSPSDTDPLRMKAASTFAREFVDGPIVGQSPEEIANNAIKAWFTQTPNSFTPDRLKSFGQGLDLLNKMQVAWDLALIPPQFLPELQLTTVAAKLTKTR